MKKFVFCLVVVVLLISGCSSTKKEKPDDISQDIWDKSIQYAIMADQYKGLDGNVELVELMSISGELEIIKGQNEKEKELTHNVRYMVVGKFEEYYGNNDTMNKNGVIHFNEARELVVGIIGESSLNPKNLSEEYAKGLKEGSEKPESFSYIKEYQEEHRLKAKDVQYDMANNLDKDFFLEGTATLDDYYNYGFGTDIEPNYFCARVTSDDGSDDWSLYFHRESFEELFEALKSGDVHVTTTSRIPSSRYEEGQGNMAEVQKVDWNR